MRFSRRKSITILAVAGVSLATALMASGAAQKARPQVNLETLFSPSGWMGDGEYGRKYIGFGTDPTDPHSPPDSLKITYTFGPTRWGGIYWQNLPDNWGDKPGNNYAGKGFSRVVFWARGALGGEVVELKAGGIDTPGKKYKDSFQATAGRIRLSKNWQRYQIDLSGANLKSVIGGFCWVASADYNQAKSVELYLDDILLE